MSQLTQERVEKFVFVWRGHFTQQSSDTNKGLSQLGPQLDPRLTGKIFVGNSGKFLGQTINNLGIKAL